VKLGVRSKVFLLSVTLIAISLLIADAFLRDSLDRFLNEHIEKDLMVRLSLVERSILDTTVPIQDIEGWDRLADELGGRARSRVTIIRQDGVVLGDSEVSTDALSRLENHRDRPEFKQALAKGKSEVVRFSTTYKAKMLYAAVALRREGATVGVVRVAIPLLAIDQAIGQMRQFLTIASILALIIAALLSGIATYLASRTVRALTAVAQAMAQGDLNVRTYASGHDELAELGRTLDRLAQSLSVSIAEVRSERDLMQGILNGMREGVLLLDQENRFLLVNPAFREMFLLGSDLIGRPLLEVIRHAELKSLLDQTLHAQSVVFGEIEVGGIKPRRLLVHGSKATVDGGALLVLVDVTDQRRLETMRRDFVANASHELRTPVASIRSALETANSAYTTDPVAAAEFLEIADRNSLRLQRLIDDLLDLSRIESRELKLHIEPIPVGKAIFMTMEIVNERAIKKGVTLRAPDIDERLTARADRRAVEQVLTNLLDNAIKYCPTGTDVTLRAAVEGNHIRVSVEDRGPGIDAQHLPRLFERFYRVDAGRSRELGGTGLGLAIVKHLIEAMGGTVDVQSTLGRGTTFSFTLPGFTPTSRPTNSHQ
jgi:two-component system phosphate regulon sensor histidine kinase PhoR